MTCRSLALIALSLTVQAGCVSISIQTPRAGMILAPKKFLPLSSVIVKNMPNERASCGTIKSIARLG